MQQVCKNVNQLFNSLKAEINQVITEMDMLKSEEAEDSDTKEEQEYRLKVAGINKGMFEFSVSQMKEQTEKVFNEMA